MKNLKKICYTLAAVLLLTYPQPVLAAGDSRAPRLSSVEITDYTREDNDLKYMIKVAAADDISGIDHITVQFKNLSNDRMVGIILRAEDGIDGVYSGWLKINAYEKDGTFTLYKVTLTDYAGNYQVYCRSQDIDTDSKADYPASIMTFILKVKWRFELVGRENGTKYN